MVAWPLCIQKKNSKAAFARAERSFKKRTSNLMTLSPRRLTLDASAPSTKDDSGGLDAHVCSAGVPTEGDSQDDIGMKVTRWRLRKVGATSGN